ncbi:uncharacterized protein LOC126887685 isoform X1 [Diabrotica virgifera virgifera]|uniref:CHK kinase-like domain-containing protein n=1 Tax=Diabrotica virgifera virgifera TaxID=50390 RepID=A0ABM5KM64_DIAVI|nr:uncharacterized protein LOC126887685 isoform X1 [Diabrotica virgifera virgifera]
MNQSDCNFQYMTLPNLESLIAAHIGENQNIVDTNVTSLVGPGENYGGELFKIDVNIEDSKSKEKYQIHLVGKTIPKHEESQQVFKVQTTFKSEIAFYDRIVPALRKFQKENDVKEVIDCFPKYYGSRLNLNGSSVIDRDGVILLENLKISGYRNLDRYVCYNLAEAKILLKDLAEFQSTVVALKLKHPDVFKREVRHFCQNDIKAPRDQRFFHYILVIEDLLQKSDLCKPYISKIRDLWYENFSPDAESHPVREPFATISHRDLWVNNAMMKFDDNKAVKNKFIDFQIYDYGSPATDVLNFLLTSANTNATKNHFDYLLHHYHSEFVSNLKQLGCDPEPFNYSNFLKELELEAHAALTWAVGFVPVIVFGRKGESYTDTPTFDFEDRVFRKKLLANMMPEAKERLFYIVEEFIKKKWL